MPVTLTISISEDLAKKLNNRVDVLNNDELRTYILSLIEKDVNKK